MRASSTSGSTISLGELPEARLELLVGEPGEVPALLQVGVLAHRAQASLAASSASIASTAAGVVLVSAARKAMSSAVGT